MNEIEIRGKVRRIDDELTRVWDTGKRWALIREYYSLRAPYIQMGHRISPYELSALHDHLTPIERELWIDIRRLGLPLYLQYPVGRRFVDFGDPVQRIAIEADGAAFHSADDDKARDQELMAQGWLTLRIAGRDTMGKRGTSRIEQIAYTYFNVQIEQDDSGSNN